MGDLLLLSRLRRGERGGRSIPGSPSSAAAAMKVEWFFGKVEHEEERQESEPPGVRGFQEAPIDPRIGATLFGCQRALSLGDHET